MRHMTQPVDQAVADDPPERWRRHVPEPSLYTLQQILSVTLFEKISGFLGLFPLLDSRYDPTRTLVYEPIARIVAIGCYDTDNFIEVNGIKSLVGLFPYIPIWSIAFRSCDVVNLYCFYYSRSTVNSYLYVWTSLRGCRISHFCITTGKLVYECWHRPTKPRPYHYIIRESRETPVFRDGFVIPDDVSKTLAICQLHRPIFFQKFSVPVTLDQYLVGTASL